MKIIFLGTPDYLNPIIKSLDENFDLIKTIRSPKESLEEIKDLRPDLLVVASFGKIISKQVLEIPRLGTINIHPSKLPKYRGPSPIQSQILDGVTDSAISFILMDEKMDHGPLIFQEAYEIKSEDTFESLLNKMFARSADILPTLINSLNEGKITPINQNESEVTYCNEIKKEDGYFDIEKPPSKEKLDRMIRAFHPWPGTWTKWNNKIVKILPNTSTSPSPQRREQLRLLENPLSLKGEDQGEGYKQAFHNNEGKYLFQMEGKKAVSLKDFLNGYPAFPIKDL